MKKMSKLTRKLFLSAIALGLAVVTLTTTTFAWYTSSTQAQASNGSASTSGTTADSSLLISADGSTFNSTATIAQKGVDLVPLQYDATNNYFKQLKATEEYKVDGKAAGIYSFTLYFKSNNAAAVPVYIQSLTIKNANEGDLTLYDSLNVSENGGADGLPTASKYAVDVVNALDLVIKNDNSTDNFFNYDLSGKIADTKKSVGFTVDENANKTPNAINYYNKFMTKSPIKEEDAPGLSAFTKVTPIGTIPATTAESAGILEVTFILYLNGWDKYCFDACRGQSFSVGIIFTTDRPTE